MQSRHNIWTYQSVIVNLSDCKLRYMLIKGDKKGKKNSAWILILNPSIKVS